MFWFTVNTVARPIQNLAVVNLELTTLAYIFCALAMTFFWRDKPMEVRTAITLECKFEISKILEDSGNSIEGTYHSTPLDFVGREEWTGSLLWRYYVNILRRMKVVYSRPKVWPVKRFSSFNFPPLTRTMIIVVLFFGIAHSGIFIASWNFHYPTEIEKLIWHICSLGTMLIVIIGGVLETWFILFAAVQDRLCVSRTTEKQVASSQKKSLSRLEKGLRGVRNNCPDKDPAYNVPLHSIALTTPLCAAYTVFRWYILAEDIVGLRNLPDSVFKPVDWTRYLPHF
jgi:hypothetical protein